MSKNNFKYPRTFHLTFSPGCSHDDKKLKSNRFFLNKEVIISSKLDGSNFCLTHKECFARTHSGPPKHKSFDLAKSLHNKIKYNIPKNLFVYAEYCFAQHSITYTCLPAYLLIFNILDIEENIWLSWNEVEYMSNLLNIPTVPVLFKGIFNSEIDLTKEIIRFSSQKEFDIDEREGCVIRIAESFKDNNFHFSTAKMVRAGHVQTSNHWKDQEIIKNKLR